MTPFTEKSSGLSDRAASRGAVWLTLLMLALFGASLGVACSESSSSDPQINAGGSGGIANTGGAGGGSGGVGTGGGDDGCVEAPDLCGVMHRWCPPEPAPPMTTCGGGGGGAGGGGGEGGAP